MKFISQLVVKVFSIVMFKGLILFLLRTYGTVLPAFFLYIQDQFKITFFPLIDLNTYFPSSVVKCGDFLLTWKVSYTSSKLRQNIGYMLH